MKVAVCVPIDLHVHGGVEKHVLRLAEAVRKLGVQVDVFGKVPSHQNVPRTEHFEPLEALRSESYDIFHTHSGFYSYHEFKLQCSRRPRQRWVHTLHTVSLDYLFNCRDWLNWRCYYATLTEGFWSHYADRVIAVSGHVQRLACQYYHVQQEKIAVIYNGFLPTHSITASREQIRQRLRINPQQPLVLFVGRGEDKVKGTDLLTRCMNELYAEFPRLRLVAIPGSGFYPAAWLCSTGPVPHQDIPAYYRAADIFVNTSLSEGLPLTVVEAMAAGLPIVAARAGGIPEIIRHEQTGLLLRPDRSDLAVQLRRILHQPQLGETLGKNAQRAAQQLTWENLARQTLAVYESLRP